MPLVPTERFARETRKTCLWPLGTHLSLHRLPLFVHPTGVSCKVDQTNTVGIALLRPRLCVRMQWLISDTHDCSSPAFNHSHLWSPSTSCQRQANLKSPNVPTKMVELSIAIVSIKGKCSLSLKLNHVSPIDPCNPGEIDC
jgi:hypothetical protein